MRTLTAAEALLRDSAYLRVWMTGLCTGNAISLETLVVGVYTIETTKSPFFVALVVILRLSPFVFFGTLVGTIADRGSPKLLLVAVLSVAALVSSSVFFFVLIGQGGYWLLATASLASGMVWAADMPLRRRILGDIAGMNRIRVAMSLDSATNNGTRLIGPLVGGLLYERLGTAGAFALNTSLYIACMVMIYQVPSYLFPRLQSARAASILDDIREVWRFALQDCDAWRILVLTVVFNAWGFPFVSMIPVIGHDVLGMDARLIGGLAALEGAGAFFGAAAIAFGLVTRWYRQVFYFSIVAYLILSFATSSIHSWIGLALTILLIGLAGAGFSAMQSTLIYTVSPPQMRSRFFGLVAICIGAGLVGTANMGLMAEWFGAAVALRIVAAEGLVLVVWVGLRWGRASRRRPG